MLYYYLKTFHLLFVLTWFAGLIAMGRLFVLQCNALEDQHTDHLVLSRQYKKVAKWIWYYMTWPALVLSFIFAFWMIHLRLYHMADSWMQVKIVMVVVLMAYQVKCHLIFKSFQQDIQKHSKGYLHYISVIGIAFFVAFLFLMVLKDAMNWVYGTAIAPGVILIIGILITRINRPQEQ